MPHAIDVIFGGTRIGNRPLFMPDNNLGDFFDILAKHGVTVIDTAQCYGNSEATLGQIKAGDRFTIDTKWSPASWGESGWGWATTANIIDSGAESIKKLGVAARVFYLHKADPKTPIAETLLGVNELFKRGAFQKFGLSGFSAAEVERVHNHCVENGYPLPTVYQGSYNPIGRSKETTLFPTLRKLNMAFYAYGPSAGGFLGKTSEWVKEMAGDLSSVSATCKPYVRDPKYVAILETWHSIANKEGITGAELAYRWVAHHSPLSRDSGDALIIGVSSPEQLEETLSGIANGPLSAASCESIQEIWDDLENSERATADLRESVAQIMKPT